MPTFDDQITTTGAPEEVWKALYDPARFPEWWTSVESVNTGDDKGGEGDVTFYPPGYPDFPMPQSVTTSREDQRVKVSCMVSDLVFEWRLEPLDDGGTRIDVHVEIPEAEAARLATQREVVASSLRRLADLAASTDAPRARG
jgi:uncharacterized protein YndB with AHSA1/START domain